jgi:hypothetical protein
MFEAYYQDEFSGMRSPVSGAVFSTVESYSMICVKLFDYIAQSIRRWAAGWTIVLWVRFPLGG